MRNDMDAMRAKNEALEAENRNLRQKLEEQVHPKKKFSLLKFLADAWDIILRSGATFGWLKIGGVTAGTVVLALIVPAVRGCNEAWDRRNAEARAAGAAEELALEAAAAEAHRAALERMRSHTPRGVDPTLWAWCIDHCARAHEVGSAVYTEGIVTAVDRGMLSSDLNIEGPWLHVYSNVQRNRVSGTHYRVTEFGDIPVGSLLAMTYRYGFPTVIETIDVRDSEFMREHPSVP
jgi:hypothetical protein